MWTWSLNWGEVTPHIVVGTCPMTTDDLRRLHRRTGVSAILSLQHDDCLAYWGIDYAEMCREGRRLDMIMERCQIHDFDIEDMRRRLPEAVQKLALLRLAGHRVYVHCTAGMGRSPLTVWAYLSVIEGEARDQVLKRIVTARPEAVPSPEAFEGFRRDMLACCRDRIQHRAYELYLQGLHPGDAQRDWRQAEAEVLAQALIEDTQNGGYPGKSA